MTSAPPTAMPAAGRYAGTRINRVEDQRLLTGTGTFVDDVSRPGMLHACFVRSPIARARIGAIDTSEALTLAGVHAVLLAGDLNPDVREQWHTSIGPDVPEIPRPPLADSEVRFVGDPVALVIAQSRYIAEDAAELIVVDYEPLPAVVDYAAAAGNDALVHETTPGNVVGAMSGPPIAEVDAVFASAAHVVSETFRQHAYAPVPMETRGLVVEWSAASDEMTIWASTQVPHEVRLFCSRLLGLPEHRIRVVMRDTGGGFGQKVLIQREEMCLMLAARKIPAPIKWIEDRSENLMAAGQSRHEHAAARMAFDDEGTLRGRHWTTCRTWGRTRHHGPSAPRRWACCSPGRTASHAPRSGRKPCSRTPSGEPRTAVRGSSSRSPGRCSSTSRLDSSVPIPSSCADATC